MINFKYAYKDEDIDDIQKCTLYTYFDCFSDQSKTIATDEAFGDIEFENKYHIITDGSEVTNVSRHIIKLMRSRLDELEFTDVNVYLTIDGILVCNINLSTEYKFVDDIEKFVYTLITSTDGTGVCKLSLTFSRRDTDTFTITKTY